MNGNFAWMISVLILLHYSVEMEKYIILFSENIKRLSKAEKRRQKKANAAKERENMIAEDKKNEKFSARNIESDKISSILKEKNLVMFEIKPDGNW